MKKALPLLLIALLPVQALIAQTLLSGRVSDTADLPLPNINVMVYAAGSRSMAAFGVSDGDGNYKISVNVTADSLDLKTNSAFFEKITLRIANRSQQVHFRLREEMQQLKGVTIRARSIEQKGDTLEYIVGSFVQKQDKSIEDVLKRMPGIEVEDNGKITYQGLPIQKFYVEGMDLMDGNYTAVSKNLPHQSVSSVEVYENHQPIKMLEDRVGSEQASINIKLSKNVALTGSAKVGVGAWPFLWNLDLTPMLFSGKAQFLAAYRTNNTGDDLSHYTMRFSYDPRAEERPQALGEELSLKSAAVPLFNAKRYLDNRTHLLNLNTLTPLNSKTQMRVNLYYINDLQRHSVGQRNTFYLAADTLSYTEQIDNRYRDNRLFGTITLNRNDEGFYIDNKTRFSRQWNHALGTDLNNGSLVAQNLQTPTASIDNDLRLLFPVGKRIFDFVSYIGYGRAPHCLEVSPGPFALLLNDNLPYGKVRQDLDSRQFFADHACSAIFTAGRFSIRPKAGFLIVERRVASRLTLTDAGQEWQSPAVPEAFVRRRNTKPYFNTEVEYKHRDRFSVSIALPLCLQSVAADSEKGGRQSLTKLLFNPSIGSRLKIGHFWILSTSARLRQHIENYDSWMDGYMLADYQDLVLRMAPFSLSRTLSGSMGVQFKEPFMSLNADAHYGIGRTHSEMMYRYEIGEGGSTHLQIVSMPNDRIYQTLNANIRKYFSPIRTSIGLKSNLLDMQGVSLVNGRLMDTRNFSYSLSPSLMTKLTSWLNADYSLNFNRILSMIDGQNRGKITYWRHFAKAFAFLKHNQTLTLEAEYYRHQGKPFLFTDAAYEFSVSKPRLDFELRWNNIFNSKQYVSYFSGPYSVQETIYTLRPMEVLASVRFRF